MQRVCGSSPRSVPVRNLRNVASVSRNFASPTSPPRNRVSRDSTTSSPLTKQVIASGVTRTRKRFGRPGR